MAYNQTGLKRRKTADFLSNIALLFKLLKKSAISLFVRKPSAIHLIINLSIGAKMFGGDVPYYVKIWRKLTNPFKTPITNQ